MEKQRRRRLRSLLIGALIGATAGALAGWFWADFFYQQRTDLRAAARNLDIRKVIELIAAIANVIRQVTAMLKPPSDKG